MSCNNLPSGCSQAALDRAIEWDDDFEPELSDAELEAEYVERLDLAAGHEFSNIPPNVFHELPAAPVAHPMSYTGWEAEFRAFLKELSAEDVREARRLADAELYNRPSPLAHLADRKPASLDYERLGYALATGRLA